MDVEYNENGEMNSEIEDGEQWAWSKELFFLDYYYLTNILLFISCS